MGTVLTSIARLWVQRLTLAVVLVSCIGGGAFVLVSRPHGDCVAVGDMMNTYAQYRLTTVERSPGRQDRDALLAAADTEAAAAARLREQADAITLPPLRTAAIAFADGIARSAQAQRDDAERPPELDPFDALLPEVDPSELAASDTLYSAAHIMLTACPGVPAPVGLG